MVFTNDNIGDEIELTYPQGTTFTTIVVENTCPVCGDTYIGPKEEVAHLLAQHSIIHGVEVEQHQLGSAHLDDGELRNEFEAHAYMVTQIYEMTPDIRRKILASLKVCLSRYASIRLSMSGDGE